MTESTGDKAKEIMDTVIETAHKSILEMDDAKLQEAWDMIVLADKSDNSEVESMLDHIWRKLVQFELKRRGMIPKKESENA